MSRIAQASSTIPLSLHWNVEYIYRLSQGHVYWSEEHQQPLLHLYFPGGESSSSFDPYTYASHLYMMLHMTHCSIIALSFTLCTTASLTNCAPSQDLRLNEAIVTVAFKRRPDIKQYIPLQPAQHTPPSLHNSYGTSHSHVLVMGS